MSFRIFFVFLFGLIAFLVSITTYKSVNVSCVNIYDWYGVLPRNVLEDFERETGIKVNYDVFDNNEMIEAKLLAKNSGYDVVFPTLLPYALRQLSLGVYQKIDKKQLPNLKADLSNIDPFLIQQMKNFDPSLDYFFPYYWGTVGIAFDEDRLNQLIPDVPKDSYALLFDKNILSKLKKSGVSLLQEAVDVFNPAIDYLGFNHDDFSLDTLMKTAKFLAGISSYVRRFSSSRFVTDLVFGEVCIAQSWSGEAIKAIEDAQQIGRHIRYIIPKEGTEMWIDVIAIPSQAPHPKEAHVFINYLLRPQVSAQLTNFSKMATMIHDAKPFIHSDILNNPLIFPDPSVREKLCMHVPVLGKEGAFYNRVRDRIWTKLKVQRNNVIPYIEETVAKLKDLQK